MKKILFFLLAIPVFLLFSCQNENGKGWEGTKLIVEDGNYPANIKEIRLVNTTGTKYCVLNQAGICESTEYFNGNVTLTISYSRLTEEDKKEYLDYGYFTDSENSFKVYINGVEAENEKAAETVEYDEAALELNVNTEYFRTNFDIGDAKEIKLTFANAPEKIKRRDVKLADETGIAYIDIDELRKNCKSVYLYYSENDISIPEVVKDGLLFFKIYEPGVECSISAKDNYYIDDTSIKVEPDTYNEIEIVTTTKNYCCFKVIFNSPPKKRSVIKLSCETKAFDTKNFAGKKFDYVKNSAEPDFNISQVNNASLELSDDTSENKTFNLNLNNKAYTGSWIITDENKIKLSFNNSSQSELYDGELEYYSNTYITFQNNEEAAPPNWCFSARNHGRTTIYNFVFHEKQ